MVVDETNIFKNVEKNKKKFNYKNVGPINIATFCKC
jgi:hypothetical protein